MTTLLFYLALLDYLAPESKYMFLFQTAKSVVDMFFKGTWLYGKMFFLLQDLNDFFVIYKNVTTNHRKIHFVLIWLYNILSQISGLSDNWLLKVHYNN